jgi:hypothetical protein
LRRGNLGRSPERHPLDAGLPDLQGKAKRVTTQELIALSLEFYRDKFALQERHIAGAQHVRHYDFNNTYQWVINREDGQVGWLRQVLTEFGAPIPDRGTGLPVPEAGKNEQQAAVIRDDDQQAQRFLDKWRPRVAGMTHARHRKMLEVILGETVEHKRFFEQMLQDRDDLLGRRADGAGTGGGVLSVRWLRP